MACGSGLALVIVLVAPVDNCTGPLVGTVQLPSYPFRVDVQDNYAYVAGLEGGLHIVDVSDPVAPWVVSTYPTTDETLDVEVHGDLAFLAEGFGGLKILDVSDPSLPVYVGAYPSPVRQYIIRVEAGFAYLAGISFFIIDVRDPSNPVQVGNYNAEDFVFDLAIKDGVAYIARSFCGLRIADLSDPTSPILLGDEQTCNNADFVCHGDDLVLIADSPSIDGLRIIDVAQPTTPSTLASIEAPMTGMSLVGNRLFTASYGWQAFDVSNPEEPIFVGAAANPDLILTDIEVQEGYAYLTDIYGPDFELYIYDVSDCLPPPCPADIDGDGKVDPFDSNACMARFGCDVNGDDPVCAACDLDGDGVVNPFDSNAVQAAFGDCP